MAERKLDIFKVLGKINSKDINFVANLTEDELTGFQPLVAMMWMCSTSNNQQQFMVNEYVNKYVFELCNHKELLYKLMVASSAGANLRYKWKKRAGNTSVSSVAIDVIRQKYHCSGKIAAQYRTVLDDSVILEWAEDFGFQKDEITKLKRQLK